MRSATSWRADHPERRGEALLPDSTAVTGRSTPARLPARFLASGKCTSRLGFGLEVINSRREEKTDLLRRLERCNNVGNTPLSSNLLDSALDAAPQTARGLVTESQMVAIVTEQERTGLSEDDIRASWPDINLGSELPGALEFLSKSRAFRLVVWLRKQPTGLVPEFGPQVPCRCEDIAAVVDATSSAEAQAMWVPVLEVLAEELPRTTFDTWLKDTEGLRCDGDVVVVRVPSVLP